LWSTLAWGGSVSVSPVVRHAAVPSSDATPPATTTAAATVQESGQQTAVHTAGSTTADERIVVQEGEHLMGLAQRYLAKPKAWREWAKYNGLEDADHIREGQVLRAPLAWLRREDPCATVSALSGRVNWVLATGRVLREVRVGDLVQPGMSLAVGERGGATLDLGTGVRVMVQPQTQMGLSSWRLLSTGRLDALLDVPHGRVVVTTPSADAAQAASSGSTVEGAAAGGAAPVRRIRVRTPSAVLAVRGTTFEAGVEQNQTLLSTQTGTVTLTSGGQTVLVPAGLGAKAVKGMNAETEVLLSAPVLTHLPTKVQQLPLQFDLATTGLTQWRAVVARDVEMTQVLHVQAGTAPTKVDWLSLPNARYVMQLQGVSPSGLTGLPALHAFEVAVPRTQMGPLRWLPVRWLDRQGGFKLDVPPTQSGQRWLVQLSLDKAAEQTVWQFISEGGEVTLPSGVAPKGAYLGVWLLAPQSS